MHIPYKICAASLIKWRIVHFIKVAVLLKCKKTVPTNGEGVSFCHPISGKAAFSGFD